ncbi:MAG: hypothetical protein JW709_07835 [Sedimentisphaerales bacterium]|nr:hypothetical protein [Sedimentisphaerales bacterium]
MERRKLKAVTPATGIGYQRRGSGRRWAGLAAILALALAVWADDPQIQEAPPVAAEPVSAQAPAEDANSPADKTETQVDETATETEEAEVAAESAAVKPIPHSAADFAKDGRAKAVVIVVDGEVDEGLYSSIQRRTDEALAAGATTVIYQIDTFGGRVDSAISIWKYFMQEVGRKAHTVAYIPTEALSAGAMISVACQDVIMRHSTKIGDCAPISLGGSIEGVEREKIESPLRSYFKQAAETNGYPVAVCEAMVTIGIEVYQIKNKKTGAFEYFKGDGLPDDAEKYDLDNKKLIDTKEELETLTSEEAKEYGIARAVVDDVNGVLTFLEERDGVTFERPAVLLKTTWSEELVRFLASPTITGILFLIALLGIYTELNTPGVGLPGAVAIVALAIMFGSKFLIGMANWWEIAVFVVGMGLLMVEIFLIPGFGVTGIAGIILMVFGLGAMLVGNRPNELPIPTSDLDWEYFEKNLQGMGLGFLGFLVGAYFISKYLPKIPWANRLILAGTADPAHVRAGVSSPLVTDKLTRNKPLVGGIEETPVKTGQRGKALSQLRPAGRAMINGRRVDVVTQGSMIEADVEIIVVAVEGNRVVVKPVE